MNSANCTLHKPVLLNEVLDAFDFLGNMEKPLFLDCTLGGGGHSEALLKRHPNLFLVGLDQDPDALERSRHRLAQFSDRLILINCNFRNSVEMVQEVLAERIGSGRNEVALFDGILADLGLSSDQLADNQRGFSFIDDAPLDMRMSKSNGETAAELLNESDKSQLKSIFTKGGLGPKLSGILASKVMEARPLETTSDLRLICESIGELSQKPGRNAATIPFQAVRMAVNDELEAIGDFMHASHQLLAPAGRLGVISFHSLEDRKVVKSMRGWARGEQIPRRVPRQGTVSTYGKLLTKKAVQPSEAEISANPRSRSSKMRLFERGEA